MSLVSFVVDFDVLESLRVYQKGRLLSRCGGAALGEDGGGFAGELCDEECDGVGAFKLEVAAEFFGGDVDAVFLDFEVADRVSAEVLREDGDAHGQDFGDFEAAKCGVGDCG